MILRPLGSPGKPWREGMGRGPSGRRRGNGPPCLQRVAGLRGRSATLGLRHGPDSYGRQQWGILRNGGNPDAATLRADEVIRDVNRFQRGRTMTVLAEEAPANYVPAAAVIRRGRALSESLGVKRAGGLSRRRRRRGLNPRKRPELEASDAAGGGGFRCAVKCADIGRTPTAKAASWPASTLRRESWGSEQD